MNIGKLSKTAIVIDDDFDTVEIFSLLLEEVLKDLLQFFKKLALK